MKTVFLKTGAAAGRKLSRRLISFSALVLVLTGCASKESLESFYQTDGQVQTTVAPVAPVSGAVEPVQSESMILREGETVNVSFPGSSSLNTAQQIRTDGKIVMPLVGEVTAAGKTPMELQDDLIKLYAPQLATKQVIVTVQSSSFPVYVTGAVLRPGPVMSDHPMTALEAVMEAGGFDYTKANLKAVQVIRQGKTGSTKFTLNLKQTMQGGEGKPFYLKASDIVYVPEKFTWF